jgi:23S rRNA (guanine2445-N2)-methyltransferase / 23S rRNA (guanine2069-N7)-methyltransferase
MSSSRILVTCAKGIPPYLKAEIRGLGLPVVDAKAAGVMTEGTLADCMRLNLWIRTGQRVLFLLHEFDAADADELYRQMFDLPWENYIAEDGYLSVTSSVKNPTIRDTRFAGLRCKDAIVDRIKARRGRRPDSGVERDRAVVFLHWRDRIASIYLDTTGEPLTKRGYRKAGVEAPMQETLAAAVVLATGWGPDRAFINPMCGSGTLAIEAALIGIGRAPASLRTNFGFMHLKGFDRPAWEVLRRDAAAAARRKLDARIIATDVNPGAVDAAKRNAAAAGVASLIEFGVCDFADTPLPEGPGVVVFNPEYGERMGDATQLESVYRGMGDFLKKKCPGRMGYVFTSSARLAFRVGLNPSRRLRFFNGELACELLEYELYAGKR